MIQRWISDLGDFIKYADHLAEMKRVKDALRDICDAHWLTPSMESKARAILAEKD